MAILDPGISGQKFLGILKMEILKFRSRNPGILVFKAAAAFGVAPPMKMWFSSSLSIDILYEGTHRGGG